eukprot:Rmarinus@m.4948
MVVGLVHVPTTMPLLTQRVGAVMARAFLRKNSTRTRVVLETTGKIRRAIRPTTAMHHPTILNTLMHHPSILNTLCLRRGPAAVTAATATAKRNHDIPPEVATVVQKLACPLKRTLVLEPVILVVMEGALGQHTLSLRHAAVRYTSLKVAMEAPLRHTQRIRQSVVLYSSFKARWTHLWRKDV